MSRIALYNILRKIPGVSDNEAEEAVDAITRSKDVATKADAKEMATKRSIERTGRIIIMWIIGVGLAEAGIIITVLKLGLV